MDGINSETADAGRIAGGVVGFIGGAKVGTLVVPVPVLGTFLGAVVGGVVGSEAGDIVIRCLARLGGFLMQGVSTVTDKTAGTLRTVASPPPS